MRKSFYATLILYFLTFTLFGQVLDRELESFLADKESFFLVKLDQNSQEIDIVDHSAYLSAGPFTLVLIYKEPIGVLVNFSLEPTLYNGFREGKEMGEIVPNPDLFMGLAENDFNLEDRIFIHPIAPHYLYYQDGNAHRFSQISNQAGYIECRRKVSVFSLLGSDVPPQAISALSGKPLYLVFQYSRWGADWKRIVKQRDYLKISFD